MTLPTPQEIAPVSEALNRTLDQLNRMLLGRENLHRLVLAGILARGHILLEGLPGLGKTALVKAVADIMQLQFKRIQFTPDLMPGDILGSHILQTRPDGTRDLVFQPGPVFCNILLADEINRASPKTQSAMLETMQERSVTLLGTTRPLPQPFFVLASQNPIELEGTYPLPEAQLDRFLMRVSIGYPTLSQQIDILTRYAHDDPRETLEPVTSADEIAQLIEHTRAVHCAPPIKEYIASLTARTRVHEHVSLGVSPRGALYLMRASQGAAFIAGRDYVIPDDVQKVCVPVLAHRLMVRPEARIRDMTAERVIQSVTAMTDVPASYR